MDGSIADDREPPLHRIRPYLAGLVAVMAATVVVAVSRPWIDTSSSVMVFLVAVLWTAVRQGRAASLVTAGLAAGVSNFLFFEPYFAFGLLTTHDTIVLAVFLLVAFTTATLAARAREQAEVSRAQAELAQARSDELAALLSLSQDINAATGKDDLIRRVEARVGQVLGRSAVLHLGALPSLLSTPGVVPLRTPGGTVGALTLDLDGGSWPLPAPSDRLLRAITELAALGLERAELSAAMEEARVLAGTERFRAALLSSVTHDFRTPIGSIIGASSTLLSPDATIAPDARRALLTTVLQAAQRLDRYVRNLLDLTSIQSGAVAPNCDWHEVEDVIGSALNAGEPLLADRFEVWGGAQTDPTYLRIFIGRLRHKIEATPSRPRLIVTEPGVGYRLNILPVIEAS